MQEFIDFFNGLLFQDNPKLDCVKNENVYNDNQCCDYCCLRIIFLFFKRKPTLFMCVGDFNGGGSCCVYFFENINLLISGNGLAVKEIVNSLTFTKQQQTNSHREKLYLYIRIE